METIDKLQSKVNFHRQRHAVHNRHEAEIRKAGKHSFKRYHLHALINASGKLEKGGK